MNDLPLLVSIYVDLKKMIESLDGERAFLAYLLELAAFEADLQLGLASRCDEVRTQADIAAAIS